MIEPASVYKLWDDSGIEVSVPEGVPGYRNVLENRFGELKSEGLDDTTLTQIELEVAAERARKATGELISRLVQWLDSHVREGDIVALEALFYGASEFTARLNALKDWDPAVFERFARKQLCWPTLEWPSLTTRAKLSAAVKVLKVGADVADPVNRAAVLQKRANNTQVREWTTQFVLEVYHVKRRFADPSLWHDGELIPGLAVTIPRTFSITSADVSDCLRLSPLTPCPEARQAWLTMAEKVATREAGGSFSEHPALRAVGQQQANNRSRLSRADCEASGKKWLKTLTGVAEDAIRKGMKTTLKSLALNPDKLPIWATLQLELNFSTHDVPDVPNPRGALLGENPPCIRTRHLTPAATAGQTKPSPRVAEPRPKLRKPKSSLTRRRRLTVSRRARRKS